MLRLPHREQVSRSRDPAVYHREYCGTVRLYWEGRKSRISVEDSQVGKMC